MLEASTKNEGILEAIREVRGMSLKKTLRALHEARLKEIRDRNAREDYVRNEGWNAGRNEGLSEGMREGEDKLNRLNASLIADNRLKDLERAIQDKEYREQLYQQYGL